MGQFIYPLIYNIRGIIALRAKTSKINKLPFAVGYLINVKI
jgi:hypothetical protein